MKIDVVTIFPKMVQGPLAEGIVARAIARGLIDVGVHDLREFTSDRHRVVDDIPFGGGPGMVLKPEPLFAAVEAIVARRSGEAAATAGGQRRAIVLTSPDGERLTHATAARLSALDHLVILCGRYEGVDERVRSMVDRELSIGDYVLTGGELGALVVIDAVLRLLPGAIDEASTTEESFAAGLLEYPQYTRPAVFEGLTVPPVLVSGHHEQVRRWRLRESLRRTLERRPDLLDGRDLSKEEARAMAELRAEPPVDAPSGGHVDRPPEA